MPKKQISTTITSELLARAFGFLLSIILARKLEIEDFGRWNYIQAILTYLVVLIEFGSNQEGIRKLVKSKESPSEFGHHFDEVISNRTIGATISLIALTTLPIIGMLSLSETTSLAVCVLAYTTSKDWFLRATGHQLLASLQNTIHLAALIAFVYLFHLTLESEKLSPEILTTAKGIVLGVAIFIITHKAIATKKQRSAITNRIKKPSSSVIYLVLGSLLAKAYFNSDIIMIDIMLDSQQVGLYSAIAIIYSAFIAFRGTIISTLYPSLCSISSSIELRNKIIKTSTVFGFLLLPIFIILLTYIDIFISLLLGDRYLSEKTLEVSKILILTCIILSFGLLYPNALHINGMSRTFFKLTLSAGIINIGGNLLLIPEFGITAAAYTTLAAESFVVISSALITLHKLHRK